MTQPYIQRHILHTALPALRVSDPADLLALGFGTVVVMWLLGYVCLIPALGVPLWLTLVLLLGVLFVGGMMAGRYTRRGLLGGAMLGLLVGLLNLLVMATAYRPPEVLGFTPTWLGFAGIGLVLQLTAATAGAAVTFRHPAEAQALPDFRTWFPAALALLALLVLLNGGLVSALGVRLLVPEWQSARGFPLGALQGGNFFEAAHRISGPLLLLGGLCLALYLQLLERRGWVKLLGWSVVGLVLLSALLGVWRLMEGGAWTEPGASLRAPELDQPVSLLVIFHALTAHLIVAGFVALAVVSSRAWRSEHAPLVYAGAAFDRFVITVPLALLVVQLAAGAVVRHGNTRVLLHVVFATVILLAALVAGSRVWGHNVHQRFLRTAAALLPLAVVVQILAGFVTLIVRRGVTPPPEPSLVTAVITTLHLIAGNLLLGLATFLVLWTHRLVAPDHAVVGEMPRGE